MSQFFTLEEWAAVHGALNRSIVEIEIRIELGDAKAFDEVRLKNLNKAIAKLANLQHFGRGDS
jgi:hypothetical protein